MNIGLTYDLRQEYLEQGYSAEETAEFDKEETIQGIEQALHELGHTTERIGTAKALVRQLSEGRSWNLVFNIAEGLYGFGRESVVPCLLDTYRIPYTFADPLTLALCLHKAMCKRVARDLGIATPDFAVVRSVAQARALRLAYPLFAKPVAEGTGKGITDASVIHGSEELLAVCRELLQQYQQPVLVERFLPGREFTVGIVGTDESAQVVGTIEVNIPGSQTPVYSYDNKENYLGRVDYHLLEDSDLSSAISKVALDAWRGLGCRDAGRVDIRLDVEGRPMLLEVNPLAGLNPVHSDLPILSRLRGWSYTDLIEAIIDSASERTRDENRRSA